MRGRANRAACRPARRGARRALAAVAVTMVASSATLVALPSAGAFPRRGGCLPLVVAKADLHIAATRREGTLGVLVAALQARQDPWSLNAAQIAALQSAASGATALDLHVQGTCYSTVAAFRVDATPLFTDFRVYWLRVPQTRGIEAADRLGEARSRLVEVAGRLATHVGSNVAAGADLAFMNRALAAADARLGTPPTPAPHIAALAALAPAADMSADDSAMEAARGDLLAARASLLEARADGLKVVADLGA